MLSALGVIEPPDMVFAIEPQNSDFLAHQWTQLLAHLLRENKFAIEEIRDALAILGSDTEKNIAQLLQLLEPARGFIETFKFNTIVVHCSL